MVQFFIPILPKPKLRPRLGRYGVFTPRETQQFERTVQQLSQPYLPAQIYTQALRVEIQFILPKPKSSKNQYPIVRPDLDNYVKAVLDSLNGRVWQDDSQIVELVCTKTYVSPPQVVGISLLVNSIEF